MEKIVNRVAYKLPNSLNAFQEKLYIHLINWKWKNITKEAGLYNHRGKQISYDAILPESVCKDYPLIYPAVISDLKEHQKTYPFNLHQHFNHMASSQAANVNLFLPILLHPRANDVLKQLKTDLQCLATNCLYKGFRIEFWDGNSKDNRGLLGDHAAVSGTDSDIAIAYYNKENNLCLWLIEHKLIEKEFTQCGGIRSKARDESRHSCSETFAKILQNKDACFYHDAKGFEYWNLTEDYKSFFVNHSDYASCPFRGGMNQLWRNQLLGFALERSGHYQNVFFSVVRHPDNRALDGAINEYKKLIGGNPRFCDLNSKTIVDAVNHIRDAQLSEWSSWYCDLYTIE